MCFKVVFITTLCVFLCGAEFPTDPRPCKYEETKCITKLINYFLDEKNQGDTAINLPQIEPLLVSKINIKQGADSPVNIDLTFTNNSVIGLKTAKAFKVKGFGEDLTNEHEVHLHLKSISFQSNYAINGKILILPISGSGRSNLTMVNLDITLYFSGTRQEKDGATYMKINNMRIELKPERLYYNFDNLFNGDKALSDNMNLFLNENWKDIYNEIEDSLTKVFAKIYENVVNNVFSKLPYNKFFTV